MSFIPQEQKNSINLELCFQKTSCTEGWDKVRCCVDQRFTAGLLFPLPEIPKFKAFRDSGEVFLHFSGNFLEIFLGEPRRSDPGNNPQPCRVL